MRSFINFDDNHDKRNLVEFRAGKMTRIGTTVSPVKDRKGLVYLLQTEESSLHFRWKDRKTGQIDDDFIVLPNEVEFKRVPQCTTGRVFVLKFNNSPVRHFYWMQEPKADRDDEYERKINEYINNPPVFRDRRDTESMRAVDSLTSLSSSTSIDSDSGPDSLMRHLSILSTLSQILHTLPKQSSANSSVANNAKQPITMNDFLNALNSVPQAIESSDQNDEQSNTVQENLIREDIDLTAAINYESLKHLQSNEDFMKKAGDMLPVFESDGIRTSKTEEFVSSLQSPQFSYALRSFSAAFQTGHLGQLMEQFGLNEECVDAANDGDLLRFSAALERLLNKDKSRK